MTIDTHEHTTRCWWNPDQARWNCRDRVTPSHAGDGRRVLAITSQVPRVARPVP